MSSFGDFHNSDAIEATAHRLHDDVTYGAGMRMIEQVIRTASLVHDHGGNTVTIAAALLHKAWETKRVSDTQTPMSLDDIEALAGEDVRAVVEELASEPDEPKNETKQQIWATKAAWASALSPEAQTILLAEKIINFETSRDKPNPKWPIERHTEYYETRMLMVDALQATNTSLYDMAVQTRDEGLVALKSLGNDAAPADAPKPPKPSLD